MHPTQKREQFRAILAGDQCIHPASVFDPLSVRIAEDLGYELAFMAGSTASATVLGAPDLVVLTLSEFAEQIRRICARPARLVAVVTFTWRVIAAYHGSPARLAVSTEKTSH